MVIVKSQCTSKQNKKVVLNKRSDESGIRSPFTSNSSLVLAIMHVDQFVYETKFILYVPAYNTRHWKEHEKSKAGVNHNY
jgi:hypothetical protein